MNEKELNDLLINTTIDLNLWNDLIKKGILRFYPKIWDFFDKEYNDFSNDLYYNDFIKLKDLGIQAVVNLNNEKWYGKDVHCDYYVVTDEKKWIINKIKYGF